MHFISREEHMMTLRADRRGRLISSVCRIEMLEPRQLFNSVSVTLDALQGKSRRVLFNGPTGTPSYMQAFTCNITLTFEGNNLQQSSGSLGVPTVDGNITRISTIDVLDSSSAAAITLHSKENIPVNN